MIGKKRILAGRILLAAVSVWMADIIIVMLKRMTKVVQKQAYLTVFSAEMAICAILLLAALDVRYGIFSPSEKSAGRYAKRAVRIGICGLSLAVLFQSGRVFISGFISEDEQADHAIVLGMALEDGKPAKDLLYRISTAAEFHEKHPQARLVLTGGNPDKEGRTEAAVMYELLAERGVPAEAMDLEDQAASTEENFANTAAMVDPEKPIVLITSNYHMNRAVRMAEKAGFARILRQPAASDFLSYGASLMWEVITAFAAK